MQDNTVAVDRSTTPHRFEFAPRFNVAVPFIDRHLGEGRGEQTGTVIIDGLGSTENLHIFIANRPDDIRPGTSGTPVDGYRVKLVDDADNEITEPDVIGTVWVRGESAATLYWNNPDKTAATMRGDWLNTGDMYFRDADGYYHNAGRGDEDGLIKPAAFVVLNDPSDAGPEMEAALVRHCRDGLAHYKYPRWFFFPQDLPKTATGKIQRFRLREQG